MQDRPLVFGGGLRVGILLFFSAADDLGSDNQQKFFSGHSFLRGEIR